MMLLHLLALVLGGQFSSIRDNGTLSATELARVNERHFTSPSDVDLFHVDYPGTGYRGQALNLSGLVAMPKTGAPKGLVIYFHGTTTERDGVPSRLSPSTDPAEARMVVAAFCEDGYAVVAPDYAGLGDDPGPHPYPIASDNCYSGIQMVGPFRALAASRGWQVGASLWITGYSEGGSVAMWAAKRIEAGEFAGLTVAGCAPLSGPYDLSGTEIQAMFSAQSNVKWLGARFFLASYLGLTFSELNPGVKLDDLFVPSFASYVRFVFGRDKSDIQIVKDLAAKGLQIGAWQTIKRVLQPSVVRALEKRDSSNALAAKVGEQDCYDWLPTAPLHMVCLANDYLVVPENAERALGAMRKRGASSDLVTVDKVTEHGFDHITFVPRALVLARKFFDSVLDR